MGETVGFPTLETREIEMLATVQITFHEETDAITRITGPKGDEWREHMYRWIKTEDDVLTWWAASALADGIVDICQLDGWADLPAEAITMSVVNLERE